MTETTPEQEAEQLAAALLDMHRRHRQAGREVADKVIATIRGADLSSYPATAVVRLFELAVTLEQSASAAELAALPQPEKPDPWAAIAAELDAGN